MFFKGEAGFNIVDNNGEYGFEMVIKDTEIPEFEITGVAEDGNSLTITCQTSLLPGKDITAFLEFEEDTFTGYMKIPFIGKIKLKDGKRVA